MMVYYQLFSKETLIFMTGLKFLGYIVMGRNIMEVDLNLFHIRTNYYISEELITQYNN